MSKQDLAAKLTKYAMLIRPPKSQYDTCVIGACVAVAVGDIPRTDAQFLDAAHGLASGLFGPAFRSASYGQTSEWIDMCERALREAAGAPMRG